MDTISNTKQKARDASRGQQCSLHPWRTAYAICAYCGRPFCYQDVVETKDAYYCTEDAEALPAVHEKRTAVLGRGTSIIAGILIIFSAFLFFYFSFGSVSSVLGSLISSSANSSSLQISQDALLVLLETIFMAIGVLASLAIFANSNKSAYAALLSCVLLDILLTYGITISIQLHTVATDAIIIVSTALLLYYGIVNMNAKSRIKSERATAKENMERWPGAGKF